MSKVLRFIQSIRMVRTTYGIDLFSISLFHYCVMKSDMADFGLQNGRI